MNAAVPLPLGGKMPEAHCVVEFVDKGDEREKIEVGGREGVDNTLLIVIFGDEVGNTEG